MKLQVQILKTDGDVEVVNKDLHIATLDEDGRLYMELTVNRGRGYVTQNKNKSDDNQYQQYLLTQYILQLRELTLLLRIQE